MVFFMILMVKKKIGHRTVTYIDFKIGKGKSRKDFILRSSYEKKILDIEKKLNAAHDELEELRGKREKVEEAKKKFEQSKRELEKLQKK